MKHLLPLTLLPLLLAACTQPPKIEDYKDTDNGQVVESDNLTSTNGSVVLSLPSGWAEAESLNPEADLQAMNEQDNLFAIVLTEPKEDFDLDVKEHSDLTIGTLLENVEEPDVIGPTDITLSGMPALQYQVTATIEGINVVYVHTTIKTDGYYHQILLWTTKSQFRKSEQELMGILDRLEFKG